METSFNPGTLALKKAIFSSDRSCPALTSNSSSLANLADAVYGEIASILLDL